jgi:hypothetical protein
LYYFDEGGFASSLPTHSSWRLPGQRQRVPYAYPRGRGVKTLAAYEPLASEPWLGSCALARTWTSEDVLAYRRGWPQATVPRVVVLDNAGIHTSKLVKAQRQALSQAGIDRYCLPPYSPEWKAIEPVFQPIKHHEMPLRRPTSKTELRTSVDAGFATRAQYLRQKSNQAPRRAA